MVHYTATSQHAMRPELQTDDRHIVSGVNQGKLQHCICIFGLYGTRYKCCCYYYYYYYYY